MSYIGNSPSSVAFPYDTFSGNGSTVAFTMQLAPANTTSVMVFVSGVKQDPSTYSVSGTTLTFSAAPPSGTSNISAIYLGIPASGVVNTAYRTVTEFTATASQTTFTVPSYTVGYMDVFRNGVRLNSADYTATSGTTVVLASGATAGDAVTTESFYVSSVLNAIPAVANAVTDTYLNTGAVTQNKVATGVAGTGPAFSAYLGGAQTVSAGTFAKVQCATELFDTASCYDTSNYRFTPNVAGYYQVTCAAQEGAGASVTMQTNIYKNGTGIKKTSYTGPIAYYACSMSGLVYMNGTTDYLEFYCYSTGNAALNNTSTSTYFEAALIRSA